MRFYSSTGCIIMYLFVTFIPDHSQGLFDMFNDIEVQPKKFVHEATKVTEKIQENALKLNEFLRSLATLTTEYRTVLTAYRHIVKDWREKFSSKDAKEYRLLLTLSPNEIKRLDKFASSSSYEQKNVLSEVHTITELLKRSVHKIEEDRPDDLSGLTWSAWLRSFDINGIIKVILVLIMIGVINFISIRTHLSRDQWFTTFFIVVFIVFFIQNWYTLYQEAQAKIDEILMKKLPKHCHGQSMGFLDTAKAYLGGFVQLPHDECFEFHKALRATPHAQVTPVQALSMTFAQLFVTPMGTIGESLSQFFAGTMGHVPVLLLPIIFVLILFIFVIDILIPKYLKYEVHLPFMMGSLRPSPYATVTVVVEQMENLLTNDLRQLEDTIKKLQLELQQKNLQLEHHPTATTARASRPSSSERNIQQQRERSSSNRRPNTDALGENYLEGEGAVLLNNLIVTHSIY